jgi:O-antigen/teichoic acid export membrane protein
MREDFFKQTSHYTIGNALATIAALVSFPILTRLLTIEEYGLMALITSSLGMLVAFGKCGVQNSTIRFYSETRAGSSPWSLEQYYATVVYGMATLGAAAAFVWLIIITALPESLLNDERLRPLLYMTVILVFIRVIESSVLNIFKAREQSGIVAIFTVLHRYGVLAAVVLTLYFVSRDLFGLFGATIVAELTVVVVAMTVLRRGLTLKVSRYSSTMLRAMLAFGIPMVALEVSGIVLNIGDRYIIQTFLGAADLGIYAAAYNLSEYIHAILLVAIVSAVMPMYLRLWEDEGAEVTIKFINAALRFYFVVSIPMIAGLSVIGSDLLSFLASEKFAAGATVIPWVISGKILGGSMTFLGAGLYINKQGLTLAGLVAGAAIINVLMNLFMVPAFGIEGAAMATLLSFALLGAGTFLLARRSVGVSIPWLLIIKTGAVAGSMYLILPHIQLGHKLPTLVAQVTCGALYYAAVILVIDESSRRAARDILKRFR